MPITRREFFLGTGAGLVLPAFFDRVFAYCENHKAPFLQAPRSADKVFYATKECWDDATWELNIGLPDTQPPRMSIREFCAQFAESDLEAWYRANYSIEDDESVDLNDEMDCLIVLEWWVPHHLPANVARRYIETLDLGPQLQGREAVGRLQWVSGMASDYLGVHAVDDVSLSLFQNRLNELNTGYRIELWSPS